MSRRTVGKWVQRFRQGGADALTDRSSRPGRPRHQTPAHVIALIRQLRVTHGLPAWALGPYHARPSAPGCAAWGCSGRRPSRRLRCSVTSGRRRRHNPCRHQAARALPAGRALERAIAWYRARGITCQRVLSDNGSGYRSRVFREGCADLALRHRRTRPYTPRANGKAERFIQTLLREWAYVEPYATSQERRRALRPGLRYYNRERPHASLGYQPPLTRLQSAA